MQDIRRRLLPLPRDASGRGFPPRIPHLSRTPSGPRALTHQGLRRAAGGGGGGRGGRPRAGLRGDTAAAWQRRDTWAGGDGRMRMGMEAETGRREGVLRPAPARRHGKGRVGGRGESGGRGQPRCAAGRGVPGSQRPVC